MTIYIYIDVAIMGKIRKPGLYEPRGGRQQGPFIIYSLHYRVFLRELHVGTRPARARTVRRPWPSLVYYLLYLL